MSDSIPQINIEAFSSAIGVDDWKRDEFLIFEGPIPPPKYTTPIRQDYYPFVFVEQGRIRNRVDLRPYDFGKNDLFFLRPSQIIQVESISPDCRGKIIAFERSFLAGENGLLLEKLGFLSAAAPSVITMTDQEAISIFENITRIRLKVEDMSRPHRKAIANNLITALLLEIDGIYMARHLQLEKTLSRKEIVNSQFLSLLSDNFLQQRTVSFYADSLSLTPKYLTELTKEVTGKTAGELIDDRVILEAKVLLRNPDITIKKVAEILHFSDQFFFSKYFKNFTGISPSQYRDREN